MSDHDDSVVRIGVRQIYESLVRIESAVANLTNNALHAENWRVEADRDIRELDDRLNSTVTRKELYSWLMCTVAVVSAVSPFLVQVYGS